MDRHGWKAVVSPPRARGDTVQPGGVVTGVRRHVKSHPHKDLCRAPDQQEGLGRLEGQLSGPSIRRAHRRFGHDLYLIVSHARLES
eukprot:9499816-Pyramimonas_sp.AAC.1